MAPDGALKREGYSSTELVVRLGGLEYMRAEIFPFDAPESSRSDPDIRAQAELVGESVIAAEAWGILGKAKVFSP